QQETIQEVHDSTLINVSKLPTGLYFDMRYAGSNNFLKEKVYPCDNCLLRYEVAMALKRVSDKLKKENLTLTIFDCFRPISVQYKMWDILPDSRYVANPHKKGSVHNRGAAVDLTLSKTDGSLLEMGTDFDFFGKQAHHNYTDLPIHVLENRKLLKSVMESEGFKSIATEWWHYVYGEKEDYQLSSVDLCE
ncbi:MAG: M15 family metallopeptidase, partial [Cyclobacteriaceae bacterium]